ncbi:MAG TPA: hypothetical protein PLY93_11220 [Turneriella sp.]|nr:hypothetical protein [Turneriella sp.]
MPVKFITSLLFASTIVLHAEEKSDELREKKKIATIDAHAQRKAMLPKLIDAGILMLEGSAYHQFIRTFVDEEEMQRFKASYTENDKVEYMRWGREKGAAILRLLRTLRSTQPDWVEDRACFYTAELGTKSFSFVYQHNAWFIENHSECPKKALPSVPKEHTTTP